MITAAAKSLQSCLTLCDPIDSSPTGSPVPGILQARTLEWVAISFSNAWKWKAKVKSLSRAWLLAIPWTAAHQAPLSMGFSRQEYWSGVPLPSQWATLSLNIWNFQTWRFVPSSFAFLWLLLRLITFALFTGCLEFLFGEMNLQLFAVLLGSFVFYSLISGHGTLDLHGF